MNPHRLEIGGKGKLYSISTVKEFYTRNVQMDVDDALRIVSRSDERYGPGERWSRGSSRTSKHRAPRRRSIPRDIIRLWIIRGTRRTRTFRSETGQSCQPLRNFN